MPKKQYNVEEALLKRVKLIAGIRKRDAAAQKKKENSQLTRLKKNIKTILTGPGHSKAGKKHLAAVKKKKSKDTARTKTVTKRLRTSGLTEKEINRLRGKR